MVTGNPSSLQYFLQDELYLLNEDKAFYAEGPSQPAVTQPVFSEPPIPQETPKPKFNCLGNNNKRFLILVHYTAHEHMDPAHQKALESTLGRKELALADVAILNLAKIELTHHTYIIPAHQPERILILGNAALLNELKNLKLNTIFDNQVKHLYSYSFDEMLADREKAKAFWEQMKNF